MAITYTPTTNFGAKDSLPTNDPDKVIKGSEFTTEFTAIQTAFSLAAPVASPTFTGTVTIPTADINGGTIDGVTIGGSSAGAITGTTITGTSFVSSGDMTFGDNDKAIFGAGSDLAIYHDGSNSHVRDQGTGNLQIEGQSDVKIMDNLGATTMAVFRKNGPVFLNHNNVEKLATTSTGIDVTGTVTADGLTVDGVVEVSSNFPAINLMEADTVDNNFRLFVNGGKFSLQELNDAKSVATDRVVVDTSGNVGIGTTSPAYTLDTNTASAGTIARFVNGVGRGYVRMDGYDDMTLQFYRRGASVGFFQTDASGTEFLGGTTGAYPLVLYTNNTERMRITSSGNVGIGTSSPTADLSVGSTATSSGDIHLRTTKTAATITPRNTDAGGLDIGVGWVSGGQGPMTFTIGSSEAMRIDSSGNLLVGKTDTTGNVAGISLRSTGLIVGTVSGGTVGYFNRTTSDGTILDFRKDNAAVGSITADSGYIAIGKGDTGILFQDGGDAIQPRNITGLANRDAAIDLGVSGGRFKDLYLSGVAKVDSYVSLGNNGYIRGDASGELRFQGGSTATTFYNSDNTAERMRIDASGNVGIGTSSPNQLLEVADSSGGATISISTDQAAGTIASKKYTNLDFSGYNNNVMARIQSWDESASTGNGYLTFHTTPAGGSPTERARIDSSGNFTLDYNAVGNRYLILETSTAGDGHLLLSRNSSLKWQITSGTTNALQFYNYTAGSESMRIDSSGNLLVGVTSTGGGGAHLIQASSANVNSLQCQNSNATAPYGPYFNFSAAAPNNVTNYFLACADSNANRLIIRSNGGIANYQANDVNLSDERVKTDIAPLGSMWDKFKALEIVTFKYKDQTHDDTNIGVIAQQVEAVAPEFVDNDGFGETPEGEEPLKTIYTADLYHATIKALQEAMARIETLEAEVAALKGA